MAYLQNAAQLRIFINNGYHKGHRQLVYDHAGGALPSELGEFEQLRDLHINVQTGEAQEAFFSEAFFELQRLEVLRISNLRISALPARIGELKQLHTITLVGCSIGDLSALERLENLQILSFTSCQMPSTDWGLLPALRQLFFTNTPLKALPDSIYAQTQLQTLVASLHCEQPDERLNQLRSLQTLGLNSGHLRELPDAIFEGWEHLQQLFLNGNRLHKLPASLSTLPNLLEFGATHNQLTRLPDRWASSKVTELSFNDNQLQSLPAWLCHLPALESLQLKNNQLRALPEGLELLPSLRRCSLHDNPLEAAPLQMLLSDSLKAFGAPHLHKTFQENTVLCLSLLKSLPTAHRIPVYHLLSPQAAEAASVPMESILQASASGDHLLHEAVQRQIARRYAQSRPLQKGDSVQVRGDVPFKKTELKTRLQALGIAYSPTLKADTTHVVVGKKNSDMSLREGLAWMSSVDLDRFFKGAEVQYIAQADTKTEEGQHTVEQLSVMLLSPDEPTVQVAVELLKGGGTPKSLITELFAVFKNPQFNTKMRDEVRKMLLLNASPALVKNLQLKAQLFSKAATAKTLHQNILAYLRNTELDGTKLAQYLLKFGYETHATIAHLLPDSERLAFLRSHLQENGFLLKYCDNYPLWTLHSAEWQELAPLVLHIDGSHHYQRAIPANVYRCTNARSLDLNGCFLTSLNKNLCQLQNLQTLDLTNNQLERLPDFILHDMPRLQNIIATNNPFALVRELWQDHFERQSLTNNSSGWHPVQLVRKKST